MTVSDYDRFAKAYAAENDSSLFNAYYERPAMLRLAGDVSGRRILDAGCGAGPLSEAMRARGADVTGLDVSAAMVALARQRLARLLAEAGFGDVDVEVTRVYDVDDARAVLEGAGLDVESLARDLGGRLATQTGHGRGTKFNCHAALIVVNGGDLAAHGQIARQKAAVP